MSSNTTRGRVVRDELLRIIEESMGGILYIDDLARKANMERPTVQRSMRAFAEKLPGLQILVAGKSWRYIPPKQSDLDVTMAPVIPIPAPRKSAESKLSTAPTAPTAPKRTFVELAVTRTGAILIEDQRGAVYTATEI